MSGWEHDGPEPGSWDGPGEPDLGDRGLADAGLPDEPFDLPADPTDPADSADPGDPDGLPGPPGEPAGLPAEHPADWSTIPSADDLADPAGGWSDATHPADGETSAWSAHPDPSGADPDPAATHPDATHPDATDPDPTHPAGTEGDPTDPAEATDPAGWAEAAGDPDPFPPALDLDVSPDDGGPWTDPDLLGRPDPDPDADRAGTSDPPAALRADLGAADGDPDASWQDLRESDDPAVRALALHWRS